MKKYIFHFEFIKNFDNVSELLDQLEIKGNILLIFTRVVDFNLINVLKSENCKIIKKNDRNDIYWVYFPTLDSNKRLLSIIKPYLEFPTEVEYIYMATDLDTILINNAIIEKSKSIQKKLSNIDILITHDDIRIELEENYYVKVGSENLRVGKFHQKIFNSN